MRVLVVVRRLLRLLLAGTVVLAISLATAGRARGQQSDCDALTYNERIVAQCERLPACDAVAYNEALVEPCPSPTVGAASETDPGQGETEQGSAPDDVAVVISVVGLSAAGGVLWVAARRTNQELI